MTTSETSAMVGSVDTTTIPANSTAWLEQENSDTWTFDDIFEFVVYGILLCVIGALGLVGNVISIVVLSRSQMKSSISTILIGLVTCDSLLIVTSILLFSFKSFRSGKFITHLQGYRVSTFSVWEVVSCNVAARPLPVPRGAERYTVCQK